MDFGDHTARVLNQQIEQRKQMGGNDEGVCEQSTRWDEFATELDFMSLPVAKHAVRRWVRYEETSDGVLFHCETVAGAPMRFRASVVRDDVVRFRVGSELAATHESEMLAPEALADSCFSRSKKPRRPWC